MILEEMLLGFLFVIALPVVLLIGYGVCYHTIKLIASISETWFEMCRDIINIIRGKE